MLTKDKPSDPDLTQCLDSQELPDQQSLNDHMSISASMAVPSPTEVCRLSLKRLRTQSHTEESDK